MLKPDEGLLSSKPNVCAVSMCLH